VADDDGHRDGSEAREEGELGGGGFGKHVWRRQGTRAAVSRTRKLLQASAT
jgi:hypothetical protein